MSGWGRKKLGEDDGLVALHLRDVLRSVTPAKGIGQSFSASVQR
ncbi:hypothetical protein ACNKHL_09965 [Shigella flexneri]